MALARFGVSRIDHWLRAEFEAVAGEPPDPAAWVLDLAVGTGVCARSCARSSGRTMRSPRRMCGFDVDEAALDATRRVLASELDEQDVSLALRLENTWPASPDPGPRRGRAFSVIVGNRPLVCRGR